MLNRRSFCLFAPLSLVSAGVLAGLPDKAPVTFYFSYDCPSCIHVSEALNKLEKARGVAVTRVPVPINPDWAILARIYYTVTRLDLPGTVHTALYRHHIDPETSPLDSDTKLSGYLQELFQVDPLAVKKIYSSAAVDNQVKAAYRRITASHITAVPVVVLGDGSTLSPWNSGGVARMIELLDQVR